MVANQVAESRTIEYKEELPKGNDESKRDFLADVSAFANTVGGDLIYGIKAKEGVATEVAGLAINDIDSTCLQLQNTIHSGLAPKLSWVTLRPIKLSNNRTVLILRIPRSLAAPHMITFKNSSKFYSRHSNGNYQLDVQGIRSAFLGSESIKERIHSFRHERLNALLQGEAPIGLIAPNGYFILHLIPMEAFSLTSQFDINSLFSNYPQPLTLGDGSGRKINFDGLLSFDILGTRASTRSYLQVFRNGIIEVFDSTSNVADQNAKYIHSEYEHRVLQGIKRLLSVQQQLGVEPPLFIALSFLGVKGHRIAFNRSYSSHINEPIDRDFLLMPEIMIEDYKVDLVDVMKPAFDSVWNACGYLQSQNYNLEGEWIGERL